MLTGDYGSAFHLLTLGKREPTQERFKVEFAVSGAAEEEESVRADSVDETTVTMTSRHFRAKVLRSDWSADGSAFVVSMGDVLWVWGRRQGGADERGAHKDP